MMASILFGYLDAKLTGRKFLIINAVLGALFLLSAVGLVFWKFPWVSRVGAGLVGALSLMLIAGVLLMRATPRTSDRVLAVQGLALFGIVACMVLWLARVLLSMRGGEPFSIRYTPGIITGLGTYAIMLVGRSRVLRVTGLIASVGGE